MDGQRNQSSPMEGVRGTSIMQKFHTVNKVTRKASRPSIGPSPTLFALLGAQLEAISIELAKLQVVTTVLITLTY